MNKAIWVPRSTLAAVQRMRSMAERWSTRRPASIKPFAGLLGAGISALAGFHHACASGV